MDRGNGLSVETRDYARYALGRGYRVELKEPDSAWWREIRVLLADKTRNGPALEVWARRLAERSRAEHRVPLVTIRRWMARWRPDLTVEEILVYEPPGPTRVTMTETLYVNLQGGPEGCGSRVVMLPPGNGAGGEPEV